MSANLQEKKKGGQQTPHFEKNILKAAGNGRQRTRNMCESITANADRDSGKKRRRLLMLWYPKQIEECCQRRDCLYHSQRFSYRCDYCFLTEQSKILNPEYKREEPTTEGCSLYKPMIPGYREQVRAERIHREVQQAKAAKLLRKLYPHLYADDFKNG